MTQTPHKEGTFGTLSVGAPLARSLREMQYSQPTLIQERVIPPLRAGRDVLAQAQTGSGKTAGFGIPISERVDPRRHGVQALVLVPTRELCIQVADELGRLGKGSAIRVLPIYGGVGFGKQIGGLRAGAQVVVGTPGRVEDLMQRGDLRLSDVRIVILDEADRMLDIGFRPAIERILRATPAGRQTGLFSATLPLPVRELAQRHLREPVTVEVHPERATVDEIEQRFERVEEVDKLEALRAYLDNPATYLALVFRRTTYRADKLTRDLTRRGYRVGALHGRRSQNQRQRVLADLKAGKLQALIATDIAARGLDIAGLTHVFNYDMPDTSETYVHRIGRTGRAGETGTAVTFVTADDEDDVRNIERYLAGKRDKTATPTGGGPARGRRTGPGTPRPANPRGSRRGRSPERRRERTSQPR
ncbi:MAG TPA: DEAD/DEAH box helicase [Chloroflexota bacterium]|nr:DEAD/DEAH box helicase [Chloroflexota bacterium]